MATKKKMLGTNDIRLPDSNFNVLSCISEFYAISCSIFKKLRKQKQLKKLQNISKKDKNMQVQILLQFLKYKVSVQHTESISIHSTINSVQERYRNKMYQLKARQLDR